MSNHRIEKIKVTILADKAKRFFVWITGRIEWIEVSAGELAARSGFRRKMIAKHAAVVTYPDDAELQRLLDAADYFVWDEESKSIREYRGGVELVRGEEPNVVDLLPRREAR